MLTQERLKELLYYNSETGEFTRLAGRFAGRAGFAHPKGYCAAAEQAFGEFARTE